MIGIRRALTAGLVFALARRDANALVRVSNEALEKLATEVLNGQTDGQTGVPGVPHESDKSGNKECNMMVWASGFPADFFGTHLTFEEMADRANEFTCNHSFTPNTITPSNECSPNCAPPSMVAVAATPTGLPGEATTAYLIVSCQQVKSVAKPIQTHWNNNHEGFRTLTCNNTSTMDKKESNMLEPASSSKSKDVPMENVGVIEGGIVIILALVAGLGAGLGVSSMLGSRGGRSSTGDDQANQEAIDPNMIGVEMCDLELHDQHPLLNR